MYSLDPIELNLETKKSNSNNSVSGVDFIITNKDFTYSGTTDQNGSLNGPSNFDPEVVDSNTTGISVSNGNTGVSGTNMNIPTYYALAFIMKK